MSNGRHGNQTPDNGGVHGVIAYRYANSTARAAATGFNSNFDLYKNAIDLDSNLVWMIVSIDGGGLATWQAAGAGGGGASSINISGGTTSNNLSAIVFSNSNNVSFGLNGSTITGSASFSQTVQTQNNIQGISAGANSAGTGNIVFSNSNGISFGMVGNTITATVIPGAAAGIAANQAGTQTATSGTVIFANSNGISFGMSNSNQITASYTVPNTAGLISNINISGGTTSANLSNFVFSNSNNVSFGLNGSTITASVPVQSSLSFSNQNNITFGIAGSTLTASVLNQTSVSYSNLNGISFGLAGSTLTASYTVPNVPVQTNQTVGLFGLGNTTQNSSTTLDARSLSFNGLGAASVGYSNGSIQISVPAQTAQTQSNIQAIYDGVNSISTGTIRYSNANGLSFGINGQTLTASYTVPNTAGLISNINISAGTTSNNLNALTFSNSNGLTFGLNGSVITGSYTVPTIPGATVFSNSNNVSFGLAGSTVTATATFAQTNQTEGFYAVGNTTGQSSSSTFDARTLSFSGAGIASVGYSAGNVIISVPSAGALVNFSAGTTSGNIGAVTFSNSNGISFGLSNGIITATVTPGAAAGIAAVQGGTQTQTSGTLVFANSNGLIFGISGSSQITASYTVPSTAGLISGINLSAGTTSNNLSAFTLSNSNGLSFGLNGSVITGSYSVPVQTAFQFSNSNGISFGTNASTVTASYTIPVQTNQSIGLYGLGNTTQNSSTTLDARSLSFNGLGGATVGYSNGSIQISGVTTAGLISGINASAGTTSNNLTNFVFSNSNGLAFGLNGSTITGSYTVPTQTNQTEGRYAIGNTTGQSSSSTFDARSMSLSGAGNVSLGYSGNALVISGTQSAQTQNIVLPSAGTQTATSGTVIFSNSNGISFGMSNSSVITASYTVPTQTVQTVGLYGLGNTTQNSSTTLDARSLSFNGLGAASVGYSNGSIQISVPNALTNINISAGTTSSNLTNFVFSNSNGVSFGLNGSTITGSIATQTNQTLGRYAVGNTVGQSSSSTFDARTMSISGAGIASVGYSAGNLIISVPAAGGSVNFSAGTTSNNLNAITFSDSNGVSFGLSGSVITASVPNQNYVFSDANNVSFGIVGSTITATATFSQTIGRYAVGNTVGQSSSSTFDARTMSISGAGIASVGYSAGNLIISVPAAGASINVSAGTTSSNLNAITFSNSNGVSFGLSNGIITATVTPGGGGSLGLYALGNTTQNSSTTLSAASLSFNGLGAMSVGYSNGSIQMSAPATSSLSATGILSISTNGNTISIGVPAFNFSAGTTSSNLNAITFSNSNGVSFGLSNGVITATVTPGAAAGIAAIRGGTQTQTSGTLSFANSNGISFGMSNSSVITASYTVPTQTVQTIGLYGLGNTTQNSSTTLDARSLSFNGLGNITVGYSNGSIQISGAGSGGGGGSLGFYALGNTTQNSSTTLSAASLSFNGLGAMSVGYSNGSIQMSAPATSSLSATGILSISTNGNTISIGVPAFNISAGTTSNNLNAITFSDSNGVSFGLNGSVITASVPNQNYVFSDANNVSFGIAGSTITATATFSQTIGRYAVGNTTGQSSSSTFDARTMSISGAGIASVGYSAGNLIISVPAAGASINVSAGTTSNNLNAITFSNSNGLAFGLNGSVVTGSYTIPTQTNQTAGFFALGNTTQNSSTTLDARSLSFNGLGAASVGYSNGSIQISVPTQTVQTQNNIQAIYDGANSITTGTIRFTNANGVSFSINGQIISGSVAAQTNQTVGLFALGNTTQNSSTTLDARSLSFNGLGAASVGYSNGSIQISVPNALTNINISAGTTSSNLTNFVFSNSNGLAFGLNGSTITGSYTIPVQTAQTVGLYGLGNTTQNSSTTLDARSLSFNGLGIVTVGYSNGSVQISATQSAQTQNIVLPSAGTQTAASGTVVFSNSNGITFGMSNSSVITASYTVPVQTNQTAGLYALGNTTQNSSTTLDVRSLSFNGLGIITAGYSNGSIQISAIQSVQTQNNIQAIYDGANSISTGTIRYSNANGVSFGINGQTLTGSVAVQTNQSIGLYALGNTTQNSSTTLDARSISFNGLGGISAGYSNGSIQISGVTTAGLISGINASAGTTSNNLSNFVFSNSNGLAFGLNGSTITGSYTVPTQTAQTVGLYGLGNTTQNSSTTLDARSLSFNGLGIVTVGYSNGSVQISATTAAQTNQTEGRYAIGNTTGQSSSSTFDARSLSFSGAANISLGYSGNALIISGNNPLTISAGANSISSGMLVFSNSNGISFGMNAGTITATVNPGAAAGVAAIQAGTQTATSGTVTFGNSNGITFGMSGSSQITASYTVPSTAGLISGINISAGTTSNNLSAVTFSNSNGLSFGLNGSVITGSYTVPTQTVQSIGLYAVGNTTGQSSSSSFDARSISFQGAGVASVGYTNGSVVISVPSGIANINISAGTTSNNLTNFIFSNSNNISFGLNGSTITASVSYPQVSYLNWPESPWQTNFPISNASFSLQHFNAKVGIVANKANLLMALNGNTDSSGAMTVSLGIYTMNGSIASLASSDSRIITWTSGSQTTASSIYGGVSGTRYRTVSLNNWSVSGGDYLLGMWFRTTNNGTWNAFGIQGPSIVGAVDGNETNHYLNGYSSSSFSTAMIGSINVTNTNYVRTGGNALQQPGIIFLGSF